MFYDFSSIAITVTLFVLIIILNEMGFRVGRFIQYKTADEVKTLTGSIQASILGLLALLLGFTFSMSMQRFDGRSQAVISEANTIDTVILRVQLLPAEHQQDLYLLLEDYVNVRKDMGQVDMTQREERKSYNNKVNIIQNDLWKIAVAIAHNNSNPAAASLFIGALNNMFDSQGKRNALQQMHVPETVTFLLFLVFIASGGILGYSSGLNGTRVVAPTVMVSFLIALIVFIILDLDRPKRGFIQVNQQPIILLSESFKS
ncbi:MAG: hypothetical protein ACFHVJ_10655 [Aestuariibacter sp.]